MNSKNVTGLKYDSGVLTFVAIMVCPGRGASKELDARHKSKDCVLMHDT